jgi:mRNA-degrading endonuclease toxin of MazEF toxin-antitoxin module
LVVPNGCGSIATRRAQESRGRQKPSVANVSQLVTVDRATLTERSGRLSVSNLGLVLAGIDVVLGRS